MKIRDLLEKEIDIDVYDNVDESIGIAFCGSQRLTAEGLRYFEPVLECECEVDEDNCCCTLLLDGPDEDATEFRLKLAHTLFYGAAGYISEERYHKYFKEEIMENRIDKGNACLRSCGHLDNDFADFIEYGRGQLDWAVKNLDCLIDWDEWQKIQALMGKTMNFSDAMEIHNMLWENDIEPLELSTDASKAYYKSLGFKED